MPSDPVPLKLSAAVLAGGRSHRMGTDKALVDVDGLPLVEHVARRFDEVSDDVFVVAKRPLAGIERRVVLDRRDVHTPLAGIAAATRTARHPWVFVCACDMPTISPELVTLLAEGADGFEAVVPMRDGRSEPLCALWSKGAADAVEVALASVDHSVRGALEGLRTRCVAEAEWRRTDPEGLSFVNLNTPADLEAVRRVLET